MDVILVQMACMEDMVHLGSDSLLTTTYSKKYIQVFHLKRKFSELRSHYNY